MKNILRYVFVMIGLLFLSNSVIFAQKEKVYSKEQIEQKVEFLRQFTEDKSDWLDANPAVTNQIRALLNFINKEPIDSVITTITDSIQQHDFKLIDRLPSSVADSLSIPAYYNNKQLQRELDRTAVALQAKYQKLNLTLPDKYWQEKKQSIKIIPKGEGAILFRDSVYVLPQHLRARTIGKDSLILSPEELKRKLYLDSLRFEYIEQKREEYNVQLVENYKKLLLNQYRNKLLQKELSQNKKALKDYVKMNNHKVLSEYNALAVRQMNDSIQQVLQELIEFSYWVDTVNIKIQNDKQDESVNFLMGKNRENYSRLWIKNEQNDSLNIIINNIDKNTLQIAMENGVRLVRIKPAEAKQVNLDNVQLDDSDFNKVGDVYKIATLWRIGGDGNVGFTQTYLDNWKKGGQSAFSTLVNLKGFANYSTLDNKIKWENSGELLSGWMRPGGDDAEIQKNNDKIELTSRFGYNAFKKWYYSTELTVESQIFNGYNYPVEENEKPISAFLSPVKSFFKIGLDYKPNSNFSLLLSPLTIKNVYVSDTAQIDPTRFGIKKGERSFWEPGMNVDLNYKRNFTKNISVQTKYKMFINYAEPLKKFDVNWENYFNIQLTRFMNVRLMVHLIYDDDVLFPITKMVNGKEQKVGEKPRLQVKELFTIGFSYKINRRVQRSIRLD